MRNAKQEVGVLLTHSSITTLVPETRITTSWPDFTKGFPCIVYSEVDSFVTGENMADDMPNADNSEMEIHIFSTGSTTAIFQAINTQMEKDWWQRTFATEIFEADAKLNHKVLRYSKLLYR